MGQYQVTDVTIHGASTVTYGDRTRALSAYAMNRADRGVFYGQLVEDGQVTRQFARPADSPRTMDLLP
jgi:hypothetical protein